MHFTWKVNENFLICPNAMIKSSYAYILNIMFEGTLKCFGLIQVKIHFNYIGRHIMLLCQHVTPTWLRWVAPVQISLEDNIFWRKPVCYFWKITSVLRSLTSVQCHYIFNCIRSIFAIAYTFRGEHPDQ